MNDPDAQGLVQPAESFGNTIFEHYRDVHFYRITEQELDSFFSLGPSLAAALTLSPACISIAITLVTVLLTVDVTSPVVIWAITGTVVATGIIGVPSGIFAGWGFWKRSKVLDDFKRQHSRMDRTGY